MNLSILIKYFLIRIPDKMTSSFRPQIHKTLAELIINDIFYQTSNYYYFIGGIKSTITDETENTIYSSDIASRNNILYMKKLSSNDISYVIKNHTWTKNTSYIQWDDNDVMDDSEFYVVNSENMVYKCINNNSFWEYSSTNGSLVKTISKSTIEPTGTYTTGHENDNLLYLEDGYVWKYMYSIPAYKKTRFQNTNYVPVQTSLTDSFYTNGSIENVRVLDGGSGYKINKTISAIVSAPEDIDGVTAELELFVNSSGSITGVEITNAGSGYSEPPQITVTDVGNTICHGMFRQQEGDTGSTINSSAKLEAHINDEGNVSYVSIIDPGVNYSIGAHVSLIVSGDGSGAELEAKVSDAGNIVGVTVISGGYGYTYADIKAHYIKNGKEVILENPANLSVSISSSASELNEQSQSTVEQLASNTSGGIYSIVVEETGSEYVSGYTEVVITGDGYGASAEPVLDTSGHIVQINIKNSGTGYTHAEVEVIGTGNTRVNTSGSDCKAYAILPPIGGHGKNALDELFVSRVCINCNVDSAESLAKSGQTFYEYGIIRNPKTIDGKLVKVDESDLTFKLKISNTEKINVGDTVLLYKNETNSSGDATEEKEHIVISVNKTEKTIVLQQNSTEYYDINQYCLIKRVDSSTDTIQLYTIDSVISAPTVNKFSGDLIVSKTLSTSSNGFSFGDDRTISFKTIITV